MSLEALLLQALFSRNEQKDNDIQANVLIGEMKS